MPRKKKEDDTFQLSGRRPPWWTAVESVGKMFILNYGHDSAQVWERINAAVSKYRDEEARKRKERAVAKEATAEAAKAAGLPPKLTASEKVKALESERAATTSLVVSALTDFFREARGAGLDARRELMEPIETIAGAVCSEEDMERVGLGRADA
jgi:hypothetical protein